VFAILIPFKVTRKLWWTALIGFGLLLALWLLPWENALAGAAIYSTDASFLIRNGPYLSAAGIILTIIFGIFGICASQKSASRSAEESPRQHPQQSAAYETGPKEQDLQRQGERSHINHIDEPGSEKLPAPNEAPRLIENTPPLPPRAAEPDTREIKLKPRELINQIDAQPHLARRTYAESFRGHRVRWKLRVLSIDEDRNDPNLVIVHMIQRGEMAAVRAIVKLSSYPRLKRTKDEEVVVTGVIDEIHDISIYLRDAMLQFDD
jgi:hypothetical protein